MRTVTLVVLVAFIVAHTRASWSQIGDDIVGEATGDTSGYSTSASSDGMRIAIAANLNDGGGQNAGHVRVYQYQNDAWTKLGDDIDGEATGDGGGGLTVSMSADGTRVAIGAIFNNNVRGHVRVYEYQNDAWTKLGVDIDGEATGDGAGRVSLSGDGSRVAIAANLNDDGGANAGHVRVYQYQNNAWTKLGDDIDGEASGDRSGVSVSLNTDGNRVAIGASWNGGNGFKAGHVRVYEYQNDAWTKLGDDIDGEATGDVSGTSVSMSADGTRVAIGAPYNDDGGQNAGHVRVYQYQNNAWTKLGDDIDGEATGDGAGRVSLSGDGSRVAIGAPANGVGTGAGHVRVYEYQNDAWTKLGDDIDGEATGDASGHSVSLSGDGMRVVIGAPRNDGPADADPSYDDPDGKYGLVRVFQWPSPPSPPSPPPPTSPPSSLPPSLPPAPNTYAFAVVVAGTVEDARANEGPLKVSISEKAGVAQDKISISFSSASVLVSVTLTAADAAELSSIASKLDPLLTDTTQAAILLGSSATVESIQSKPPSASGDNTGAIVGGIVGGSFVPLLMCILWFSGVFAKYGCPSPCARKDGKGGGTREIDV